MERMHYSTKVPQRRWPPAVRGDSRCEYPNYPEPAGMFQERWVLAASRRKQSILSAKITDARETTAKGIHKCTLAGAPEMQRRPKTEPEACAPGWLKLNPHAGDARLTKS